MDPATEMWIAALADRIAGKRLLLILTCRPGYTLPLGDRTAHTRLALDALSTADSARIARDVLAPRSCQPSWSRSSPARPRAIRSSSRSSCGRCTRARPCAARGAGWPWPARSTRSRSPIRSRTSSWPASAGSTRRRGAPYSSPRSSAASSVGACSISWAERPSAWSGRWASCGGGARVREDAFPRARVRLQARPHAAGRLRHAVAATEQRDVHRRIAEAIEVLHADRLAEHTGLLAHHYSRAEEWPKALEYLLAAAARAAETFATREALALYDEALEAAQRQPGGVDRAAIMAIHQAKAALHLVVSDFEQSRVEAGRLVRRWLAPRATSPARPRRWPRWPGHPRGPATWTVPSPMRGKPSRWASRPRPSRRSLAATSPSASCGPSPGAWARPGPSRPRARHEPDLRRRLPSLADADDDGSREELGRRLRGRVGAPGRRPGNSAEPGAAVPAALRDIPARPDPHGEGPLRHRAEGLPGRAGPGRAARRRGDPSSPAQLPGLAPSRARRSGRPPRISTGGAPRSAVAARTRHDPQRRDQSRRRLSGQGRSGPRAGDLRWDRALRRATRPPARGCASAT